MKEILPNIFAVEVPEDAHNFMLFSENEDGVNLCFATGDGISASFLPLGSYTFLFCSNDVTEEQLEDAAILEYVDYSEFERFAEGYPLYDYGKMDDGTWNYLTTDLKISFRSLLRSHNLTGNYAIIQKLKP